MTNKDDLRMVAEFMGGHTVEAEWDLYQSSWDKQIPVWDKLLEIESIYLYVSDREINNYHAAVDFNNPAAAFQIIVNILKRMK